MNSPGTPGKLLAIPVQSFPLLTLGAVCPHEAYIPVLCAVHFIQGELDFSSAAQEQEGDYA